MSYQIRKWVSVVEEIRHETGPPTAEPLVKAAAGLVLRNPFAGRFVEDLSPLTELGAELGRRAAALLDDWPVQGWGGIAGLGGEQEHEVSSGGRIHHRVGGLSAEDAVGDGVR